MPFLGGGWFLHTSFYIHMPDRLDKSCSVLAEAKNYLTRMHSSRMCTARTMTDHAYHAHPPFAMHMPPLCHAHAPPLPHMPPFATHAPLSPSPYMSPLHHACPPSPHMPPLPHTAPQEQPHTHPLCHACPPRSNHTHPLGATTHHHAPPGATTHAPPQPCTPPVDRQTPVKT